MSNLKWNLDPSHSEVNFKVKHMMITNVSGKFTDFKVNASSSNDKFEEPEISFSARSSSVSTGSEQRDGHLKSADFFDAEKHPEITFKSNSFKKINGDHYQLDGDLKIKNVTKPISLMIEHGGLQKDPYGNIKTGFTIEGKINRKDFGLNWNAALETGGVMVSEEVKINCEIELVKA